MVTSFRERTVGDVFWHSAGFFFGFALMTIDYVLFPSSLTTENLEFIHSPKAWVWILFICAQFTYWAYLALPMRRLKNEIKKDYHLEITREIFLKSVFAGAFFVIPGVFMFYVMPDPNLAHNDLKLAIVNVIGIVVAIMPMVGIWYIRTALETSFNVEGGQPGSEQDQKFKIESLLRLRGDLQRFITFLGVMITLATLARGALRQAYLATGGVPAAFPPDYVLLHGAYFTGLLALLYIPTYTIMAEVGSDLVDALFPLDAPELDVRRLGEWQANRKCLENLLQLQAGALENLKASVSILAPLGSSVIAVLLESNR